MILSRSNKNVLSEWWWTVDRVSLGVLVLLALAGLVFLSAASPAVARRLDYDVFHFVWRQASFLVPSFVLLVLVSLFTPREVRRLALLLYFGGLLGMGLALLVGEEVKGAHRWLQIGPMSLQPSELVKPGFVVLSAWMLAESRKPGAWPAMVVAVLLYVVFAGLLMLQPDFGQTLLMGVTWGAMFFVAGSPMLLILALGVLGLGGAGLAYSLLPHVQSRVDRFLDPQSGDTFQVDKAMQALAHGGFFGVGPGEGQVKTIVPDAHTDFIFAVIGEEFGALTCLVIAASFALVVLRGLMRVQGQGDSFAIVAVTGLLVMVGLQALINMSVALSLVPAKGMTLPFVSSGGSSMLASAITMGMVLALTRHRPELRLRWRAA